MNLQEFKDKLRKAGWDNPNDAQGENIKKLWIENFPKDYVINGLMQEIDRLSNTLDEIASLYENAAPMDKGVAYEMRCIARKALQN